MSDKTPGQLNFEGYLYGEPADIPINERGLSRWGKLSEGVRSCWEDGATAARADLVEEVENQFGIMCRATK